MRTIDDLLRAMAEIEDDRDGDPIFRARSVLWTLNRYLYQATGDTEGNDISPFHGWWRQNAEAVVGAHTDDQQCRLVAERLEQHFSSTTTLAARPPRSLTQTQVANVRFFSAVQDFNFSFTSQPYDIAMDRPELFDASFIAANHPSAINEFLGLIGARGQYAKRQGFALNSANFLLDGHDGDAHQLYGDFGSSVVDLRGALVENGTLGFSAKKANMFIRDMFDWGIWQPGADASQLDVAADTNLMRIALRTGIVRIEIPVLIASYLDIYSYQYGAIDAATVAAWRRVWELWGELPDNHRVAAPASIDYLIYRLGWRNGRYCCSKGRRKCEASGPCNELGQDSCPAHGSTACEGYCLFNRICPDELKPLQPPKSISIVGGTGWTDGKTDEGGGMGISS